jgi:hypothetical protein
VGYAFSDWNQPHPSNSTNEKFRRKFNFWPSPVLDSRKAGLVDLDSGSPADSQENTPSQRLFGLTGQGRLYDETGLPIEFSSTIVEK